MYRIDNDYVSGVEYDEHEGPTGRLIYSRDSIFHWTQVIVVYPKKNMIIPRINCDS